MTVIEIDYKELERLVHEHLGWNNFSFVAEQECGNDSNHLFRNIQGHPDTDWEETLANQRAGKYPRLGVYGILEVLVSKGLILPGNILVDVMW